MGETVPSRDFFLGQLKHWRELRDQGIKDMSAVESFLPQNYLAKWTKDCDDMIANIVRELEKLPASNVFRLRPK